MRQEIRVLGKVSSTRIGYLEMREKGPVCFVWSSVDERKRKWPSFVPGRLLGTKELQSEGKECLPMRGGGGVKSGILYFSRTSLVFCGN